VSVSPYSKLEQLGEAIGHTETHRLFLVTDPLAYEQSGAAERLQEQFTVCSVRQFSEFEPNPKIDAVLRGVAHLGNDADSAVVAIGGGTAIDMAKLICLFAAQPEAVATDPLGMLKEAADANPRRNPLIAVPTTSGTGSEATHFAVVYVDDVKHSVSHASLLPNAVILDPTLTHSMPPHVTAATGLDALSQAVESMWSVRSTNASIDLAAQALRLGLAHLENAVRHPTPQDRAAMMQAAHLAGNAINITRTTAPHALSYTMTMRHGIAHGMAVAISVAAFLRFNSRVDDESVIDRRGVPHVRRVLARTATAFGVDPAQPDAMDTVADRWQKLLKRVGCATRLSEWNITSANDLQRIADSVNQQRLANNPRRVSHDDLLNILAELV